MDSQPTPPPSEPVSAELVNEAARGPIRVVVEQPRASVLGRIVRWGIFLIFGIWIIGAAAGMYGEPDDVQERWHSLSRSASDKIAIVSVRGAIFGDDNFAKRQIDRVRDDESVKAVVLRIDSPGGTVAASDLIYHRLKVLAEEREIPLVVSMGGIAASGGYYIAMATGDVKDTIYAEPTTWTGSIGVIIPHYNLTGLLNEFNVKDDSIASNPLKMMGSPTREFPESIRDEEQKILQGLVDASFEDFKQIVLDSRPKLREDSEAQDLVFTGRILTAKQAEANHLVDRIGFIEDAIDRAIELAALDKDDVQVVEFQQPQGLLDQVLFGSQARRAAPSLSALFDLDVPRPYYLVTWSPSMMLQPR